MREWHKRNKSQRFVRCYIGITYGVQTHVISVKGICPNQLDERDNFMFQIPNEVHVLVFVVYIHLSDVEHLVF